MIQSCANKITVSTASIVATATVSSRLAAQIARHSGSARGRGASGRHRAGHNQPSWSWRPARPHGDLVAVTSRRKGRGRVDRWGQAEQADFLDLGRALGAQALDHLIAVGGRRCTRCRPAPAPAGQRYRSCANRCRGANAGPMRSPPARFPGPRDLDHAGRAFCRPAVLPTVSGSGDLVPRRNPPCRAPGAGALAGLAAAGHRRARSSARRPSTSAR